MEVFWTCFVRCVLLFYTGVVGFEVFCPVWGLYNIKEVPGRTSAGSPRGNVVPGARVPNGAEGPPGQKVAM